MSDVVKMKPAPGYEQDLLKRIHAEHEAAGENFNLPVYLDLSCCLSLVGTLQLALRHPNMVGPSAQIAHRFIAGIIERMKESGLPAHAELMEMGNHPEFDR